MYIRDEGHPLRFFVCLQIIFNKPSDPDTITDPPVALNSEVFNLLPSTNIIELQEHIYTNLLVQIEEYEGQGSGWVIDSFKLLDLNFVNYRPLRGSS